MRTAEEYPVYLELVCIDSCFAILLFLATSSSVVQGKGRVAVRNLVEDPMGE
jgi:hypothetical protein